MWIDNDGFLWMTTAQIHGMALFHYNDVLLRLANQLNETKLTYSENGQSFQKSYFAIDLVHRVISRRHTAVGQLADFQGANDERV
jgi:hypothetical protein